MHNMRLWQATSWRTLCPGSAAVPSRRDHQWRRWRRQQPRRALQQAPSQPRLAQLWPQCRTVQGEAMRSMRSTMQRMVQRGRTPAGGTRASSHTPRRRTWGIMRTKTRLWSTPRASCLWATFRTQCTTPRCTRCSATTATCARRRSCGTVTLAQAADTRLCTCPRVSRPLLPSPR
jgi:hypothetical protein